MTGTCQQYQYLSGNGKVYHKSDLNQTTDRDVHVLTTNWDFRKSHIPSSKALAANA
jgi:hypothetical protein